MNPAVLSGNTSLVVTFAASFLIWFMFAGLIFLWFIDGRLKKEQVLHALFASLVAWVLTQMIKGLIPTLRPFQVSGGLPMTLTIPLDASFPSIHAAVAFALAVSIWLHDKKIGYVFLAGAFLVSWGRIASNVHYFGDVLVGAGIGITVSYIIEKLHLFKLVR
jgi:undecaprenyl-diphosphatase